MDKIDKTVNLKFEVDLDSLKPIGTVKDGEPINEHNEIHMEVSSAITRALESMLDWIVEFENLVTSKDYKDAYDLFKRNKGSIRLTSRSILDKLLMLPIDELSGEDRKQYSILLVAVASKEHSFGKIETIIDRLIGEFKEELSEELYYGMLLAKANAAAINCKFNIANANFKMVIDSEHSALVDKAYALRGLAKISPYPEDAIKHEKLAADRFLEAGKKNEAIKDLAHLAKQLFNTEPEEAIILINKAIDLYGSESSLDKEYKASLHHTKASLLHFINRSKEALLDIEKACELREGLIGNEHERYSSYMLSATISKVLKLAEKVKLYESKASQLAPLIKTKEFLLQQRLLDCMDKSKAIDQSLINDIESSAYDNLKFSLYLLLAGQAIFSFTQKLEWLDKANLILQKEYTAQQSYATYYYSLAEVYRLNGDIKQAIEAYENSLSHNPFYFPPMQNCAALMWENKLWDTAIKFFNKGIETLGESPNLLYALGRSHFEVGDFQSAFDCFRKIKTAINGVDISKYISKCIEGSQELRIHDNAVKSEIETVITIDMFSRALEEFAETISSNSRMHFWKQETGKYKWISSPEEKAKHHLITALQMKFGKKSIDIIQERRAGAGIIDLYVIINKGPKLVVEIKICGAGYSSTYALKGEDQLIHYIQNTETHVGFLAVFDGRIQDFGKGFKKVQSFGNIIIETLAIDLRPTVKG